MKLENDVKINKGLKLDHIFDEVHRVRDGDVYLVQIGANDGFLDDTTRHLIDCKEGWNALFVEPVPKYFAQLLETSAHVSPRYKFENSALASEHGLVRMLTVDPEVIEREGLEKGYRGMSAMYPLRNGFGTNYQRDIDVKAQFARDILVPGLTMREIVYKHGFPRVDILLSDIEGHDIIALDQIIDLGERPYLIRIEKNEEYNQRAEEKARDAGYVVFLEPGDGVTWDCADYSFVREDFLANLQREFEL